jgi:hypothetical protein
MFVPVNLSKHLPFCHSVATRNFLVFVVDFMSMGPDCVSELRPPTDLLFIPGDI